ncbi:PREDICTED: uncharacterized protein LOC104729302 isoform X1 [Camelina sativa]|uniref:Uncharacterized protein LOC104729302 isoform X1 n=1 Tax=Camelina sativa TaxID=90675 RepID=A0ABM0UUG8_CAMSA|nr:PREDICTED: uncharacterized protein LOC104729302 isoform X1 [Camelina sativa]
MLIGNRPRPQMQRTTSITRITVEVDDDQTSGQDSDVAMTVVDGGNNYDQRFLGILSPTNHRRNESQDGGRSSPSSSSSSFLGNCGLCKRRLAPGRDIYMYKMQRTTNGARRRQNKKPRRTITKMKNMHGSNLLLLLSSCVLS